MTLSLLFLLSQLGTWSLPGIITCKPMTAFRKCERVKTNTWLHCASLKQCLQKYRAYFQQKHSLSGREYSWNGTEVQKCVIKRTVRPSQHAIRNMQPLAEQRKKQRKVYGLGEREYYTKFYLFTLVTFLQSSYIHRSSSRRGASSSRGRRQPAGWSARPLRDSWLISSWLREPWREMESAGWLFRLEHIS